MSDAYDRISKVWSHFPEELDNSTLYDDINNLKTSFENKKYLFDDYLTKIVIIGNVSTGKSALINALLGKEYFETITGNGTVAFFYCSLSEKNYEYFTLNNSLVEHKEIDVLKNASRLNVNLTDYIDQNSVLNVYIKHDESKILERKTVIVDCPGFGYDERFDKEVQNHCSNADVFIFMFTINEPATLNQKNYIKTLRDNNKNPTCFFVYNKCDLSEFDNEKKSKLKNDFCTLFGEQYFRNLKLNSDPLYFISALHPNNFEDFSRLKTHIMEHKTVNLLRFSNVQSTLSNEVNKFSKTLGDFVSNERKKKILKLANIDEIKYQKNYANEQYSEFLNYVKRRIENGKNNLQIDKIFDILRNGIEDYNGKCNLKNAQKMIDKIEETNKNKISEFIEKHLTSFCIDPINNNITEINNTTTGITMNNDMDFNISVDKLTIPIYENIKNIFWWFEFGDKTNKVKEAYAEFIQSKDFKEKTKDSVNNMLNNEFCKIERIYENLVECTKRRHVTKEKSLNDDLRRFELKLENLLNYEKEVYENVKGFHSSFM